MDLRKLTDKFPPDKIEWRIGTTNKDKTSAIALAYVTNRAIQERLDEVCGAENWKNEFIPWKENHQLCGISIKIDGEWVTKWDGAENTQVEPLKGGLSASMKRAAAQWGIGRYLYDIPNQWYTIFQKGRSYVFDSKNPPKLPNEFLPDGCENAGYKIDVTTAEENEILNLKNNSKATISKEQGNILAEIILTNGIDTKKVLHWGKVEELTELTREQYNKLIEIWGSNSLDISSAEKNIGVTEAEKQRLNRVNKKVGGAK